MFCFGGSLATKSVSSNIRLCLARPTFIDFTHNELHDFLSMVSLDPCRISCNTAEDPSGRISAPNNTKDANLNVFNMITGVNESKIFIKYISCKRRCQLTVFDGRKCYSKQKWNKDECQCECKKY